MAAPRHGHGPPELLDQPFPTAEIDLDQDRTRPARRAGRYGPARGGDGSRGRASTLAGRAAIAGVVAALVAGTAVAVPAWLGQGSEDEVVARVERITRTQDTTSATPSTSRSSSSAAAAVPAVPAAPPMPTETPTEEQTAKAAKAPAPVRTPSVEATAPPTAEPPPPPPAPEPSPPPVVSAGAPADAAEAEVLALVNVQRATAGCPALAADAPLAALARAFSADMATRGFFSHDDPDGNSPWDRATAAGISNLRAENIARGQQTPDAVMASWMDSPGHRANILNCSYRTLGVGAHLAAGGPWWTQDFGG